MKEEIKKEAQKLLKENSGNIIGHGIGLGIVGVVKAKVALEKQGKKDDK